jgi:anti-sigma B factor antagonist
MVWKQIAERRLDDVVVLDLRGVVMLAEERGRLLTKMTSLVGDGRVKILLNLTDTPYLDSDGLGEMIKGLNAATKAGGAVRLFGVNQRIRHLLNVTKLHEHLRVYNSEPEAVASVGPS